MLIVVMQSSIVDWLDIDRVPTNQTPYARVLSYSVGLDPPTLLFSGLHS